MKECARIKRLLSAYLDKETGAADTRIIQSHLEGCPSCSESLAELRRLKESLSGQERKSLPSDYLVFRLRQEIAQERQQEEECTAWNGTMGRFSLRLIPVPVAVIVLAVTLLFSGARQKSSEYSLEDMLLNGNEATVETAVGLVLGTIN